MRMRKVPFSYEISRHNRRKYIQIPVDLRTVQTCLFTVHDCANTVPGFQTHTSTY